VLAGLLLGLAAFKVTLLLPFVAWFLWQKQWLALAVAAAVVALLSALAWHWAAFPADLLPTYQHLLAQVRETLGNPQHLLTTLEKQGEEMATLRKQIEQFAQQSINQQKDQLAGQVKDLNGVKFLAAQVQAGSADALKTLAFNLRQAVPNLVLVLGAEVDGKPQLAVMLADEIAQAGKLNATTLVRELAKEIQGGGGGQPFFATAGGKNLAGLAAAVARAEGLVKSE